MPRPPRIEYPGARHHVMNRGNRRGEVYWDEPDRLVFLSLLEELPERFGVLVLAYALMPNHFHLQVESLRGDLSRAMQYLGVFTQRMNHQNEWIGSVFSGRFKSIAIVDDRHWQHLVAYIHLNPARSKTGPLDDERWTSHAAYLGEATPPRWLAWERGLELFGGRDAYLEYLDGLASGTILPPEGFDPTADPRAAPIVVPRTFRLEEAFDQVAEVTGTPVGELTRTVRGRHGNPSRWILVWWLTVTVGLSNAEIASLLGTSPRAIQKALEQVRTHEADPRIRRWRTALAAL